MSYLSRERAAKSYRPRSYVMSPGLIRARAPFRVQNAVTGLVLAGFTTAVWAYSIRAVKQDDFSDVDEEAREMMRGRHAESAENVMGNADVVESTQNTSRPQGVLAPVLDRAFPRLLDPTRKTLVWGAPPLDDLGQVSLRSNGRRELDIGIGKAG